MECRGLRLRQDTTFDRQNSWAVPLSLLLHGAMVAAIATFSFPALDLDLDGRFQIVELITPPPEAAPEPAAPPIPQPQPSPVQSPRQARPVHKAPSAPVAIPEMSAPESPDIPDPVPTAATTAMEPPAPAARDDYPLVVWTRIMERKPARARHPGAATIRFSVAADGSVMDLIVENPSGIAAIDQLALEVIRRAAPFPPPPNPRTFTIPFQFR